jgi:hypothetical protein
LASTICAPEIVGAGTPAGKQVAKLCASTDAATNVARTFVDYCIYTNALGSILPLVVSGPLTIGLQQADCTAPSTLCILTPTVSPTCPFSSFVVVNNGTVPEKP